jgi:two-component system response regulator NreC
VVIADDHAVVRQGLRLLLETETDLDVIGEAGDLEETARLAGELRPDILLLDLHMGRELSLTALPQLRATAPATAVVILTMQDDPAFARQALAAGAVGYVLKETSRAELARAIRTVAKGGTYLDPAVGVGAISGRGPAALTDRETEVLRLLALGHTNA